MKKNIIFILGSLDKGGGERVVSNLANYFCKNNNVSIITLLSNRYEYDMDKSIKIVHLSKEDNKRFLKIPMWLFSLNKIFRKADKNSTVIISFVARINLLVILANLFSGLHLIISERNDPKNDGRSKIIEMLTFLLYRKADKIVFQTNYAKMLFTANIREKSIVIYNPIVVDCIKTFDNEKKEIVNIGRLAKQKNHKLLINAFSNIIKKYPDFTLGIYGEGPLREELQIQIEKLSLTDSVALRGNVSEIHKEIIDSYIFVLSSDYEGQSNALLEAMVMGMPCITTNTPGVDETVNENNGIIVEIGNVEKLTEAIEKLILDTDARKKLGNNASKIIIEVNENSIINQWTDVINKILTWSN